MQNDKIYSEIVSSLVRTKYEANLLLAELDLLDKSQFRLGEEDFAHSLESKVRAKTAFAINKVVTEANRAEVLGALREKINSLIYVGLTIAFEPSLETINHICAWIKENVGMGIALDLTIDKSILGGAVIEYKGRIVKDTLLTKVDSYFI